MSSLFIPAKADTTSMPVRRAVPCVMMQRSMPLVSIPTNLSTMSMVSETTD
jgi:hypothetical protein